MAETIRGAPRYVKASRKRGASAGFRAAGVAPLRQRLNDADRLAPLHPIPGFSQFLLMERRPFDHKPARPRRKPPLQESEAAYLANDSSPRGAQGQGASVARQSSKALALPAVIPSFLLPSFPRRRESRPHWTGRVAPRLLNPHAPRHSRESGNLLDAVIPA